MTKPVPLPKFVPGIPLGATDLMRYAINEEYLYRSAHRLNFPFRSIEHDAYHQDEGPQRQPAGLSLGDDERWIVHGMNAAGSTHRYLYYAFHAALGTTLYVRDQEVASFNNAGSSSGFVDLHPDGTDPFGLTPGVAYPVRAVGQYARFAMLAETVTNTPPVGAMPLPYPVMPTYSAASTVRAVELNQLSDNLQALLDKGGLLPNRGYFAEDWKSGKILYYRFAHLNRYLYFRVESASGLQDENWHVEVFWGRTTDSHSRLFHAYEKLRRGTKDVRIRLDLEGTDHAVYTGGYNTAFGPTDNRPWPFAPLALGTLYDITLKLSHDEENESCNDCKHRVWLVVETTKPIDIIG